LGGPSLTAAIDERGPVRHARPVRAWLPAALLCVLGCRDATTPEQAPASDPPPDVIASTDDARPESQQLAGDPFAGIEALRPEPWTGWPLENVDIELETGWRIDPVSGELELERDLTLAADDGAFVLAIAPGKVIELQTIDGALELVIDHGQGIESRYAPLRDALVHPGLPVTRGAAVGLAHGGALRLRVTIDGVAIDPLLVLRQPLHRWPALLRELPTPRAENG
jgi:murein DD-endopeptidase MepM/ murein hydrolase activator NlpD